MIFNNVEHEIKFRFIEIQTSFLIFNSNQKILLLRNIYIYLRVYIFNIPKICIVVLDITFFV